MITQIIKKLRRLIMVRRIKEVFSNDPNIIAAIIFGSFVHGGMSSKTYREYQYFKKGIYISSVFKIIQCASDVDVLVISHSPHLTLSNLHNYFYGRSDNYITINIINPEIAIKEIQATDPVALRRILLYRKIYVLKGNFYLKSLIKLAKANEKATDIIFQNEYDNRKLFLKREALLGIKKIELLKNEYYIRFPYYVDFIENKIRAGFPNDRIKFVLPSNLSLKVRVDISTGVEKNIL